MGPIEITVTVLVSAFVVISCIVFAIRKAKGKSSDCSGCSGCPYAGQCGKHANRKEEKEK